MREKFPAAARRIMDERFGKDSIIALATVKGDVPSVRNVDGFYEDGSFYIITHTNSEKMRQIQDKPLVAVCGEWFAGHGLAENLGHVLRDENSSLMERLREAFSGWYSNGHVDEQDPGTCILRVELTDGVLFAHGTRYDIDFSR